jgi:hypothetical protein
MSVVELQLTNHQRAELRYRERANLLSAGGRGSGKSRNLQHALLAHCQEWGEIARPIVFREQRNALLQLQSSVYELAGKVFGSVDRNLNDGTITLPNRAQILFSNISDDQSYSRLQGMGFTMEACDEIGDYHPNAFAFAQKVRSGLRVPPGKRAEVWWTANPRGRSHHALFKGWISKAPPWTPWIDQYGDTWVWTSSSVDDNPYVDNAAYKLQLAAATGGDKELAAAWLAGSWGPLGGNMFDVFDPAKHVVTQIPAGCKFVWRMGADWGTTAPAVCLLGAEVPPDVHGYAPRSIIVVDTADTVLDPTNLDLGDGRAPDSFADLIIEMCEKHGVSHRSGALDDAKGLAGETVIGLMQTRYLYFHKPYKKDRAGGWVRIRQMLESARTGDGPGLYIHARNVNLIESLAGAPRDPRREGDVDVKFPDHHLDALRYLLTEYAQGRPGYQRAVGTF